MLNWRQQAGGNHQRELVKRDRHAPGHRRLDRQLVVPLTNVCTNACPTMLTLAAILLEAPHRSKPRLQTARGVRKFVHAARRYSGRSPPSRSRVCMRPRWVLADERQAGGRGWRVQFQRPMPTMGG